MADISGLLSLKTAVLKLIVQVKGPQESAADPPAVNKVSVELRAGQHSPTLSEEASKTCEDSCCVPAPCGGKLATI